MSDTAANGHSEGFAKLRFLSPYKLLLTTLLVVSLLHAVSLWVFARGFLLNRVALSDRTTCTDCTLPPRYKRLVFLVVDALRDDFLFPLDEHAAGFDAHYHNVLTTPARLSREQPTKALSFRFVADPPTTTLQRLQGLTVGTLPTFIDAGSNFVGSEAEEDSWLEQASRAGKRIALMGDDTWLTVFPPATGVFHPNLTFPYDSFNVEDLDTVDDGVREHLYPLLDSRGSWDILIGHFLGLDHVGHRVGPSHPEMTRKLRETEEVVQRVVAKMQRDDLFVLLGDHGMDSKGDHGGDSALEVNAALWLYSPSGVTAKSVPSGFDKLLAELPDSHFSRNGRSQRSVAQISLVPTLSLLLGLPIPFSNLGQIIPELFSHSSKLLEQAYQLNARQVATFLRTYTAMGAGKDLAAAAPGLLSQYEQAKLHLEQASFLKGTLEHSRAVWATFDLQGLVMGILLLVTAFFITLRLFAMSNDDGALGQQGALRNAVGLGLVIGGEGALLMVIYVVMLRPAYSWARLIAGGFTGAASIGMLVSRAETRGKKRWIPLPTLASAVPAVVHATIFASNSLIVWEDRFVAGLLVTLLLLLASSGFAASEARLRQRILLLSAGSILCLRIATFARLCREEQQGDSCITTFYGHDQLWLMGSLFCSLALPTVVKAFLATSRAHHGFAGFLLDVCMRIVLLSGTGYWWLESIGKLVGLKNGLAWTAYAVALLSCFGFWQYLPLTHGLGVTQEKQIVIYGFANLFGASYLVYASLLFAVVYALAQPAGQVSLAVGFVGLLCAMEANDSRRDAQGINPQAGPGLAELSVVSLWAHVLFFASGHQATLASIQWKVAFAGTSIVRYPLSPLLVAINTFGPLALLPALITPLLVFWNFAPPQPKSNLPPKPMYRRLLRASLGISLLYTLLALSATIFAAHFRRHLMVWKIFAPRWMMAAVALVGVDVCLLLFAVLLGATTTLKAVARFVGARWACASDAVALWTALNASRDAFRAGGGSRRSIK